MVEHRVAKGCLITLRQLLRYGTVIMNRYGRIK